MEVITDFYLFLLSVIFISLSGVMMPGPLFAATVANGLKSKVAGIQISLGHGAVEFSLMFLIYFGFAQILSSSLTQKIVGLLGGMIMIYLGFRMIRARKKSSEDYEESKRNPIFVGIVMTGANPYFLLWWATVGWALITNALIFGFAGFLIFAVTHWLCDLVWNTFVSLTVFRSRRFLTGKARYIIFSFCFAVFVGFGIWFIISAII